jgi:formyltetrahydrofolate deformylase
MERARAVFLVAAPDQPGLVARLAGFFYHLGLNILDASNHSDLYAEGGAARFFMRLDVDLTNLACTRQTLEESFAGLSRALEATWSVGYTDQVQRVAILVTKEAACLYDLILRQRAGELPCEIALVAANRPALESVAEGFRIPFFLLPVTPETKRDQEGRLLELLREHHVDLVVLARYMQILTGDFLAEAPPAINIHHGFLPAFRGARPYHQAHERGVKMIGATAHYVTADLDQGPIIEQDVARVTHEMAPDELARVGRDVERVVLARAVRAHLERRILVEGRRTIVL